MKFAAVARALGLRPLQRIRGCEVVEVLERIVKDHGRPRTIRVDIGKGFFKSRFHGG